MTDPTNFIVVRYNGKDMALPFDTLPEEIRTDLAAERKKDDLVAWRIGESARLLTAAADAMKGLPLGEKIAAFLKEHEWPPST